MALLSWRTDYEVGVASIDSDHRQLFDLINEFHDRHFSGDPRLTVTEVLRRLVAYSEAHFQREEALMIKHQYPGLARQQELHSGLFASIFELNEKLSSGDMAINAKTMRFLKGWLVDHIVHEDMSLGEFIRRQAIEAKKAEKSPASEKVAEPPADDEEGEEAPADER